MTGHKKAAHKTPATAQFPSALRMTIFLELDNQESILDQNIDQVKITESIICVPTPTEKSPSTIKHRQCGNTAF
jgi:hypothetical protein